MRELFQQHYTMPLHKSRLAARCSQSVVAATFLLLVMLVIFGPQWFDYQRCPIRAWIGASIISIICLLLGRIISMTSARHFSYWGLGSLALAFFICGGIPAKSHVWGDGLFEKQSVVVLLLTLFPVAAGLVWFGAAIAHRLQVPQLAGGPQSNHRNRTALAVLGIAVLTCMAALGSILAKLFSDKLGITLPEHFLWCGAMILGVFWFIPVVLAIPDKERLLSSRIGRTIVPIGTILAGGLLLLGIFLLGKELASRNQYLMYHLEKFLSHWCSWDDGDRKLVLSSAAATTAFVLLVGGRRVFGRYRRYHRPAFLCLLVLLATAVFVGNTALRTSGDLARAIICLDARTGERLWHHEGLLGPEGSLHRLNTPATPTVVVHDDRVIAYFGSAGLLSCDTRGGAGWTNRSITFESVYGVGSSLVARDGLAVLLNGLPKSPRLYAIRVASGDIAWSVALSDAGMARSGCSRTPLVKDMDGRTVVIIWGSNWLEGYALRDGTRLWHYPLPVQPDGDNVASLVSDADRLYCVGPYTAAALSLNALGTAASPIVWTTAVRGANCSSPLVMNGLLLFVSDSGVTSCLNAGNGKLLWRAKLPGKYYASPVAANGCVYFTSFTGLTTVVRAAPEFEKLAENDVKSLSCLASPAISRDRLYYRDEEGVICIEEAQRRTY